VILALFGTLLHHAGHRLATSLVEAFAKENAFEAGSGIMGAEMATLSRPTKQFGHRNAIPRWRFHSLQASLNIMLDWLVGDLVAHLPWKASWLVLFADSTQPDVSESIPDVNVAKRQLQTFDSTADPCSQAWTLVDNSFGAHVEHNLETAAWTERPQVLTQPKVKPRDVMQTKGGHPYHARSILRALSVACSNVVRTLPSVSQLPNPRKFGVGVGLARRNMSWCHRGRNTHTRGKESWTGRDPHTANNSVDTNMVASARDESTECLCYFYTCSDANDAPMPETLAGLTTAARCVIQRDVECAREMGCALLQGPDKMADAAAFGLGERLFVVVPMVSIGCAAETTTHNESEVQLCACRRAIDVDLHMIAAYLAFLTGTAPSPWHGDACLTSKA